MNLNISVIVCTHNPRGDYLGRTLESLKLQTLSRGNWELLLIDNASGEPLANRVDLSWHPGGRHIREEQLGLTAARLRGIREAASEILVFVDDDNVLNPDYLTLALQLAREHTHLGCFGAGVLEPEFEEAPAIDLIPYTGYLALRSIAKPQWSNCPEDSIIPWGAGLIVRRVVADTYIAVVESCPIRKQLGRRGSHLTSGEDDEFSWVACDLGLGKGLFPELRIAHLISRKRVGRQYLLDLVQGVNYSQAMLSHLHGKQIHSPPPVSGLGGILKSVCRARISLTIYHTNSWWSARNRSATERAFEEAFRKGVERARKDVDELKGAAAGKVV
jgi:glycosyltransferase involved in cell wall biosynthesis